MIGNGEAVLHGVKPRFAGYTLFSFVAGATFTYAGWNDPAKRLLLFLGIAFLIGGLAMLPMFLHSNRDQK